MGSREPARSGDLRASRKASRVLRRNLYANRRNFCQALKPNLSRCPQSAVGSHSDKQRIRHVQVLIALRGGGGLCSWLKRAPQGKGALFCDNPGGKFKIVLGVESGSGLN